MKREGKGGAEIGVRRSSLLVDQQRGISGVEPGFHLY